MSALTHEQYEQFLAANFRPTWSEAETLSAAEDEPEEPFKSKYKANELLASRCSVKCYLFIDHRYTVKT